MFLTLYYNTNIIYTIQFGDDSLYTVATWTIYTRNTSTYILANKIWSTVDIYYNAKNIFKILTVG